MKVLLSLLASSAAFLATACLAGETTLRFYQGVTAYVDNPDGVAFDVSVDVRDWNLMENGPREVLFKIYDPDGRAEVRKVIEDDGVTGNAFLPEAGGWDHEMWYYLLNYGRGSKPMIRWSSLTEPSRLAALQKRTFTFPVSGGKKGIYRVMMAGSRDHVVTLHLKPGLKFALAGHPLWMHGHGDMFKRSFVYVPKGTLAIDLGFIEHDLPVTRNFTLAAPDGSVLWDGSARGTCQKANLKLDPPGKYDDQVLTMDVSAGSGDYMLHVHFVRDDIRPYRGLGGVPALFAPDKETAVALKGGAIYHDGEVFWHGSQVRLHDWLKANLKPEDSIVRDAAGNEIKPTPGRKYGWGNPSMEYKGLPEAPGFIPLNGPHEPPPLCDTLMHNYTANRNPGVLNVALLDLARGLRTITVGDVPIVMHWGGNLGYAFGTYGWHYWRPAWRVLQQSDAPHEVKDLIKEAIINGGDRLAFGRGIERTNGNAFSHIPMAMRYAAEATKDPLVTQLADTYFDRFINGGWGDRAGISKSGDCQEHFAHDFHYGTYIYNNYTALVHDLRDPKFQAVLDRIANLYSYLHCAEASAYPWGSRTAQPAGLGGSNSKSQPGPDFTVSVNDGNEWFAARRKNYYALTFHGKLTPEWLNNYFSTRMGYGGGILCQLTIPGQGTVLASTLSGKYGAGMERDNWPNFHIHSVVGTLAGGIPLVAADSEHLDAKLEGNTVRGDGEVRDRPVHVTRSYTFADDRIACKVQLADTDFRVGYENRGPSSAIMEAHEMIPFLSTKAKPTAVSIIGADGKPGETLGEVPRPALGVVIDRGGFGVRIEFDRERPVKRGMSDTVLVQLAMGRTAAKDVGLEYSLVPFSGETAAAEKREDVKLNRLSPLESTDQVKAALAPQPAFTVKAATIPLAELRLAVAGDQLAVHAIVTDPKVARANTVWEGSCIEVFGSLPGAAKIGQVFLAPQAGEKPAGGFQAVGSKIEPAGQIRVGSNLKAGGYELSALIPLAALAAEANQGKILLEFQVTVTGADGKPQRATLFGSPRAYQQNSSYGGFRLQ
jgi:hypothetical protein